MSFRDERNVSVEDCQERLKISPDIDYFAGRVIKCNLPGDSFDSWGYDRDNGEGAAQKAIDGLKINSL